MSNLENQTVNNTGNNTGNNAGNDRMFTQAEVDSIVQARLSRSKEKEPTAAEKALADREKAIAAKEKAHERKAALRDKKLPEEIYDALNCTSDEAFNKSLEILGPYFQKLSEPIANPVGPTGGTDLAEDSIRKAMGLSGKR